MHYQTYSDIFRPTLKKNALIFDIVLIFGASVLIALSAQIAIPVPFSPVPITGQTLAVLLTGALLGSRRGAMAVLIYLLEGSIGMPVFASAKFGIVHLLGPTGGYLIGFIPAAVTTGLLAERGWDRNLLLTVLTMTIATVIIFICGLIWLSRFPGVDNVFIMGLYPFIPGALIKVALAAVLLPWAWKLFGKKGKE
jgi:biotin transport system substrate-specific component